MIKKKILFLEDDEKIILFIKEFLEDSGFIVDTFNCVTDAISNIKFNSYDLLLLDLNLPDFSGMEVLTYLNSNNISIPTIIVSAFSDLNTKLQTYKLGASDYLIKPINLRELEAKIWVHLKNTSTINKIVTTIFQIKNNSIFFKNDLLKLTRIEHDILSTLITNKNCTIKKELLVEKLSSKSNEKALSYHIKNIRKKINDDLSEPHYLITEYAVGYKLVF